ncbi:MAG: hypothetical protein ACE5JT_02640 [Nitrosopumilaceae archaeon]
MVMWLVIPLSIVAALGIAGYMIYRFVIYDSLCKKSVDETLKKYHIDKTQFQIIKEYYKIKGKNLPEREISKLEKHYRQHEPDQFLAMYDKIRETKND